MEGTTMTNADTMLNKAKKDFVLRQLETDKVQKNFGPMFRYVKPTLLTLIDLYGSQITVENLQQVLDCKVKIKHRDTPTIAAQTIFPHVKNLNRTSAFFKPYITLYIDTTTPEASVREFFENKKSTSNQPENFDPDQLHVAYKFIHELCHAVEFKGVQIFKNGLPQPIDAYGSFLAQSGVLKVDKAGLLHEEFNLGDNGKITNNRNYTPEKCFANLDEGVNEALTIEVVNSPNFLNYLKQENIKNAPKQKLPIYKRQVAAANVYRAMFGQELQNAHFGGAEKILNKDSVVLFGQFCENLNALEDDIHLNTAIVYTGKQLNKQADIEYGTRRLNKDFEAFDHLVFDFLDTLDTTMRTKYRTESKGDFPQEYKTAVNEFIKSFDTIFEHTTPVFERAEQSNEKLHFWCFETPVEQPYQQ